MSLTVFVFAEDALAGACATQLLDRVVSERLTTEWLREHWSAETRASARTFVPLKRRFQTRVPSTLRGREKDAYVAVHAAEANRELLEGQSVLLMAFDSDNLAEESRMRAAIGRVLEETSALIAIVAEATPEFDAWVLMGHEPRQTHEEAELRAVCAELQFDPRERPHDLNSTTNNQRDAKRLCQRLLFLNHQADPNHPRVMQALDAPLELMLRRGKLAGFPEFVDDIVKKLLPYLGDHTS